MERDVVIAGAGPAGVACAMACVRADPSLRGRLLVLDRARFPRSKPCGGGLTGHAARAMAALGLELAVPSVASPRAVVRFGAMRREVRLPEPVRIIRREAFDASLVAQARDAGVEVREGEAITGFERTARGVTVATTARAIEARVLVGADGVGSLVRKRLVGHREGETGPSPIRLFRAEAIARRPVDEAMLYDFTPMRDGLRGYLWIFPVPGGRINVGLMHAPSVPLGGAELTALLGAHLATHGVTLDPASLAGGLPLRGWPAWGYERRGRVGAPHLLTVGDAAGIDALTGEGIAVAMEQGLVAGRAIAGGLASGDLSFARYRRDLGRATVGRELALDGWLAWLLYGGARWRRWLALILCDERLLDLYAARIAGSVVLADHKRALVAALGRHVVRGGAQRRALAAAEAGEGGED